MGLSVAHLLLLLVVIFVLFGAGKLPRVMGDLGKGIRSMREGLKGEETQQNGENKKIRDDSDKTE
jgi:sec-independent protein translocase protein TatA